MDVKNFFFYPLIAASLCWAFISILKVQEHQDFLKMEYPECTLKNENRELVFFVTMIVLAIGKHPLENSSKNLFIKIITEKRFPLNSEARRSKAQMMGERVFKVTVNIMFLGVLYKIMSGEDCDFFDTRVGGRMDHPLYFNNHPCQKIPKFLDSFYIVKIAYHCYELISTMMFDMKRPDFPEYMLHHFLTFALILFSYSVNYLPIGAAVMFLHDVTDLTTTIFKLVCDVTPDLIQILAYLSMTIGWAYFRLWYFPFHVIGRIFEEIVTFNEKTFNLNLARMLTTFLVFLFMMHIFWFYLMIKGGIKRMMNKDYILVKGTANQN